MLPEDPCQFTLPSRIPGRAERHRHAVQSVSCAGARASGTLRLWRRRQQSSARQSSASPAHILPDNTPVSGSRLQGRHIVYKAGKGLESVAANTQRNAPSYAKQSSDTVEAQQRYRFSRCRAVLHGKYLFTLFFSLFVNLYLFL